MADDIHNEHSNSTDTQQIDVTSTVEARTDGTAASRLFGLPAELRINIYEFVLLRDSPDSPVDTQWREPALLSASWRVRDEASSVYYKGNQFDHDITDCNADLMHKWVMHVYSSGFGWPRTGMCISGQPNWANLVRWCRELCDGETGVRLKCTDGRDKLGSVIEAAHDIAAEFYVADRTWEECKPVLDALRRAVGTFEPKWLE
ncbi:hypothetical protein LTR56_024250 [Elasticomyces elasticus]|nr:hypothetical protein LTR56_024250 [Elasticomyces elasticus]KAK3639676.1 hypothetical protein LTR22_017349 [Elasticomyces elasticus]KAK4913454.1 hypothetical protein LTR49_018250 [Elasticomyces elasticus]KAK5760976.1 hypothetical protein LTS12_008824 [Elasticomyces elasticus]